MNIQNLTPDRVKNAYDGRAGLCACGCSGTYWDHDDPGGEVMVARILKRMQRRARQAEAGKVDPVGNYVYSNGSECWYYETKTRLFRVESKSPTED